MSEENKYITEAGDYIAKVKTPMIKGWFGEAGKNQSPFIRIPLIVDDPESAQHGREIVWRGYLTENALERTVKTLVKAFEFDGDLESVEERNGAQFNGKLCRIVCEEEEWEGVKRVKARWLNPVDNDAAMPREKVSSLLSKINSRARSIAAEPDAEESPKSSAPRTTKKPVVKHTPKTHDEDGDEIPF
jgi:hypothetical protein